MSSGPETTGQNPDEDIAALVETINLALDSDEPLMPHQDWLASQSDYRRVLSANGFLAPQPDQRATGDAVIIYYDLSGGLLSVMVQALNRGEGHHRHAVLDVPMDGDQVSIERLANFDLSDYAIACRAILAGIENRKQ